MDPDGQIAGGLHAYPWDDMANDPPNPLIPEERYAIDEPVHCLPAPGTYYVYTLAVYPEFRGKGLASTLLSLGLKHAAEEDFAKCSLHVFAENITAVALYKKHGFKVVDRHLVTQHPLLYHPGDMILMTCAV